MNTQPTPRRASRNGESMYPEWRIWNSMINRCCSPANPAWDNYGGRGIAVCESWRRSFDAFLRDMGRRPGRGWEIDRTDNNEGYNPSNCRWVTQKQNSRNRRSSRMVSYRGKRVCLSEAAEMAGIHVDVVSKRMDGPRKWSLREALETPVRPKSRKGEGKKRKPLSNKTGLRGVKKRHNRNGYVASIMIAGKKHYSPQFNTPEEAHDWYLNKQQCQNSFISPAGTKKTRSTTT